MNKVRQKIIKSNMRAFWEIIMFLAGGEEVPETARLLSYEVTGKGDDGLEITFYISDNSFELTEEPEEIQLFNIHEERYDILKELLIEARKLNEIKNRLIYNEEKFKNE